MNQSSIIEGCRQGKEKAFKALVDQYAPKLMAVCVRYLKDNDLAKDALQESMISICKGIHAYSGIGSFDGWMTRITVHACLKEIKIKRPSLELIVEVHEEMSTHDIEGSLHIADILRLINILPENQRIVFNMHVIEGYSHQEISDLIGISESSSRVYLTRARKWLQERIERRNEEDKLIQHYK